MARTMASPLTGLGAAIQRQSAAEQSAANHRALLDALCGTPAQAKAQVSTHLQAGAAELLRLRDLLAQRKERNAANAG